VGPVGLSSAAKHAFGVFSDRPDFHLVRSPAPRPFVCSKWSGFYWICLSAVVTQTSHRADIPHVRSTIRIAHTHVHSNILIAHTHVRRSTVFVDTFGVQIMLLVVADRGRGRKAT
jgi:hypothetical protein